jgi:AhpD family alkylhydroperoxidase
MEEYLGQVPDWMDIGAEPASDHTWGIFRDLVLGETELSGREKALIGLGAAAVLKCPYCTYFHKEEARLADVSDDELREAVNVAGSTSYFSTMLHGNEVDHDEFVTETDEIVEYIKGQEPAPADD